MAKRTDGKTKLSPEVRRRLIEVAAEARRLVYGDVGCPEWGTKFDEIENDAKEVGHEFIRLLMEQTSAQQVTTMPADALVIESGETALLIGQTERTLAGESGDIRWSEPKAHLPKSRRDIFPSGEGLGAERG